MCEFGRELVSAADWPVLGGVFASYRTAFFLEHTCERKEGIR